MKLIDRYILSHFIQYFAFGLIAFTAFFLIIDVLENLDDFIDNQVSYDTILLFYGYYIPQIMKFMTPVAVLFGSLFLSAKMSTDNELTALKAGGISFYRYLLPVLFMGMVIAGFTVYFVGYIVPVTDSGRLMIERQYLKRNLYETGTNIYFQDSLNRNVNFSYFDDFRLEAFRVSIQEFDTTAVTMRLDAPRISYDTVSNVWVAFNGVERKFVHDQETAESFQEKKIYGLRFKPTDLTMKQMRPEEMNLTELNNAIEEQRFAGYDPRRYEIEYHSRFAFAATGLIVVLFGLPLSANKRKSGMALQFGINLLITFIYLGVMEITKAFGKNGALSPVMTAWLVNYIFIIAAFISLVRVRN